LTECDQIINSTQCPTEELTELGLKCVFVESATLGISGCKTVKSSCGSIMDKDTCGTKGGAVTSEGKNILCIWTESSSETSSGICETQTACDIIKIENDCKSITSTETEEIIACIWIKSSTIDESGNCRVIKTRCNDINDKDMCETEGAAVSSEGINISCLWIESSIEGINGCKTIQSSCDDIYDKDICETEGSAMSGTPRLNLECFWLYTSNRGHGICKETSDSTLECNDAIIKEQCGMNNVNNLGSDKCYWLEEKTNIEESDTEAKCISKVFFFFIFDILFFFIIYLIMIIIIILLYFVLIFI
jgi:hypothetical protein